MASTCLQRFVSPPSSVLICSGTGRALEQCFSALPSLQVSAHAHKGTSGTLSSLSVTSDRFWSASTRASPASARLCGRLQQRFEKGLRSTRVRAGDNDELPPELQKLNEEDDGKFAKISQGDPAYGPAALLLFGFTPEEKQDVQGLLEEIGGDFMKIVQATDDMLDGTLWDAFARVQAQNPPNLAADVPRMCFISGLTGEELMMLVDAFGKSKMRRPVFAALVPKNKDKLLRELIDEVMGDHRKLVIEGRQRLREQKAKATGETAAR